MTNNSNIQKSREISRLRDVKYRDTFMSPTGKEVLEELEREFLPDRLGDNLVKVGESNVIRAIRRRVKNGMDG